MGIRSFTLLKNPYCSNKLSKFSYSQEGEDILIERVIGNINKGFFVDVGAHHPVKFSNTYLFYKQGWRGINIDAMPGSMKIFKKIRPEDINLEVALSDRIEELTYYRFNYPELNTFNEKHVQKWNGQGNIKVIGTNKLKTSTLTQVLDLYAKEKTVIDLLSIDIEGMDFTVLKSIDLDKYTIKLILIEEGHKDINEIISGDLYNYLTKRGYVFLSKLLNTTIYQLKY